MKSVQKIIKEMVEKYPNDMELGARVRWYIKWLYEGTEKSTKMRTKSGACEEKKEKINHDVFTSYSS